MKTTLASALAFGLSAALISASAASYTITVVPGWNAIANQFVQPQMNIGTLLQGVPVGTYLTTFNDVGGQEFHEYLGEPDGWDPDGNAILNPGGGAFLRNNNATNWTLTFTGEPNIPVLPAAIPTNTLRLVSRQTNGPGTYENIVGRYPGEGAGVYRLIPGSGGPSIAPVTDTNWYLPYVFTNGNWSPSNPVVNVGEAVWIMRVDGDPPDTNATPPSVTLSTACLTTQAGSDLCITALATGSAPLFYQWFRQGSPIAGATGTVYCLTNSQPLDGGGYSVQVSNSAGVASSFLAQITIMPASGPILEGSLSSNGGFCLSLQTYPGIAAFLESKDTLTDAVWSVRASAVGDGNPASFCDEPVTNASRFYRARLVSAQETYGGLYVAPEFTTAIGDLGGSCGCSSPGVPSGSGVGGSAQDNAMGSLLLHTGEFTQRTTDLAVPGRGFNWRFERAYRSGWSYAGPLGYNWDFNYNRRLIVQTNGDVLRLDGLGRADRYLSSGNSFQAPAGFYTRLTRLSNGSFEELEPHGTRWIFATPNCLGVAALAQVIDRYTNTLNFYYNSAGQLTNAVDSSGRAYAYQYDSAGRLVRVADFTGRGITLGYDGNGDLVSVTSPPVTGTPTGNDFPSGNTVRYTYSHGFGDARLNHNLLSIIAPNQFLSGTPRISVSYDNNPASTNVDRVLSLTMGGSISYAYTNLGPAVPNDFTNAVFQNTVTDRNGNVTEYRFNQLGNIVRSIRFTRGLRPGEPAGYTNRFEYNKDGEIVRRINPEGDSAEYTYETGSTDRLRQGNLLSTARFPGPRGGDQASISSSATYTNFNLIATSTQPNGTTSYTYDHVGNATNIVYPDGGVESFKFNQFGLMTEHIFPDNGSGHRRRDTMAYTTNGYLTSQVVDVGGFNLTTTYEYDGFGNLVRTIDPRGNDATNIVNALNQTVRSLGRETTNGSGIRYRSDRIYDANGNMVRSDYENRDETGAIVLTNALITTSYGHSLLDDVQSVSEPGSSTSYGYDANQNRTSTTVGASGPLTSIYDERDLVFRQTRAGTTTTQYDYDGNGNLIRSMEGLEDTNGVRITTYTYDGFNRRRSATDAMGNVTTNSYDGSGNVVKSVVYGELVDVPGGVNNVRLSETTYSYDAMNRPAGTSRAFFDAETQTSIDTGTAGTSATYSQNGQLLTSTDANGRTTASTYDTANRLALVTDARGNTVQSTYDENGNIVMIVETDLSDLGGSQSFTTRNFYDNLDRLVATVDNIGITNRLEYDSRGNRVITIDGRGNRIRHDYDGLNRSIRTVRSMTSTGDGSGALAGTITTRQEWDSSSRLTAQIDDNNNATSYGFDSLDRQTATTMADSTSNHVMLDVHGNVVTNTDANGTVLINSYDLLDRLTNRIILRGPGVLGSTNEIYRYDGLSRLVFAQDDVSRITRAYDSLGRVIRETNNLDAPTFAPANNKIVATTYDGVGNQTMCVYPGGQVVVNYYEPLNRKSAILINGVTNVTYSYFGGRVQQRRYINNTWCDYAYDGARRVIAITNYSSAGGVTNIIDARTMAWDASYNKIRRSDVRAGGPQLTHFYTNDSAGRLIGTFVTSPTTNFSRNYRLDGVGNRCNTDTSSTNCTYTANSVNAYLSTPADNRSYDGKGNLRSITGGPRASSLDYDFRDLMTTVASVTNGTTSYSYDVLRRRVQKNVSGAITRFLHVGWQEIEEQDTAGVTIATYAYGNFVDEVLRMTRGSTNNFFLADEMYNVVGVSDASGNVLERYEYGDYGEPSFMSATGMPQDASSCGNSILFTSRRFDAETGRYFCRFRYLEPSSGQFVGRDVLGLWGDGHSLGNPHSYAGVNPSSALDPFGMKKLKLSWPSREVTLHFNDWDRNTDAANWMMQTQIGSINVKNLDELVEKALSALADCNKEREDIPLHFPGAGEPCCIKTLNINGHGSEGSISVGAGTDSGKADANQSLNGGNLDLLKGLRGKFCSKGASVRLHSCHTGQGEGGGRFVQGLADYLDVTAVAWTGLDVSLPCVSGFNCGSAVTKQPQPRRKPFAPAVVQKVYGGGPSDWEFAMGDIISSGVKRILALEERLKNGEITIEQFWAGIEAIRLNMESETDQRQKEVGPYIRLLSK